MLPNEVPAVGGPNGYNVSMKTLGLHKAMPPLLRPLQLSEREKGFPTDTSALVGKTDCKYSDDQKAGDNSALRAQERTYLREISYQCNKWEKGFF